MTIELTLMLGLIGSGIGIASFLLGRGRQIKSDTKEDTTAITTMAISTSIRVKPRGLFWTKPERRTAGALSGGVGPEPRGVLRPISALSFNIIIMVYRVSRL